MAASDHSPRRRPRQAPRISIREKLSQSSARLRAATASMAGRRLERALAVLASEDHADDLPPRALAGVVCRF